MKNRLSILAAGILLAGLASSQSVKGPVEIGDDGVVTAPHEHRHVKHGEKLTWNRKTSGASWLVQFTNSSPCAKGVMTFGSAAGQAKTCVITTRCSKPGDASCVFAYTSSTGPNQQQHDPDVIVDN